MGRDVLREGDFIEPADVSEVDCAFWLGLDELRVIMILIATGFIHGTVLARVAFRL